MLFSVDVQLNFAASVVAVQPAALPAAQPDAQPREIPVELSLRSLLPPSSLPLLGAQAGEAAVPVCTASTVLTIFVCDATSACCFRVNEEVPRVDAGFCADSAYQLGAVGLRRAFSGRISSFSGIKIFRNFKTIVNTRGTVVSFNFIVCFFLRLP